MQVPCLAGVVAGGLVHRDGSELRKHHVRAVIDDARFVWAACAGQHAVVNGQILLGADSAIEKQLSLSLTTLRSI